MTNTLSEESEAIVTMVTGQLGASDPRKSEYVALADEGGINATLWFGIESVVLQVNKAGQVVLAYNDGRGPNNKPVFMGFFWEIAAMRSIVSTEPDGTVSVEIADDGEARRSPGYSADGDRLG